VNLSPRTKRPPTEAAFCYRVSQTDHRLAYLDDMRVCYQGCSHGGNALRAMGSLTMQLRTFAAALHEHHDMLVDQIEFIERGNQVIAFGEEAEASTAKFLATLRKHRTDLDDLISHCEAMRLVPAAAAAPQPVIGG